MDTFDTTSLASALREGDAPTLVDVRPPEQHERAHVPRSVNVPLQAQAFAREVSEHVNKLADPVVLYGADDTSDATRRAAILLESAGFTQVSELSGGMAAWKESGQPLVSAPSAARS